MAEHEELFALCRAAVWMHSDLCSVSGYLSGRIQCADRVAGVHYCDRAVGASLVQAVPSSQWRGKCVAGGADRAQSILAFRAWCGCADWRFAVAASLFLLISEEHT